jgi:hypothetical protein
MRSEQEKHDALKTFDLHMNSIKHLIRANDVYCLLKLHQIRKDERFLKWVSKIISEDSLSLIAIERGWIMSESEEENFNQNKYLTQITIQVIQSSFAALENYLKNKFWEIAEERSIQLSHSLRKKHMSWGKIKVMYFKKLFIKLSDFDHCQTNIGDNDWFKADTSWKAIEIIKKVRNQISHEGRVDDYELNHVEDSLNTYEFIHRWVQLFEWNYNRIFKYRRILIKYEKMNFKAKMLNAVKSY